MWVNSYSHFSVHRNVKLLLLSTVAQNDLLYFVKLKRTHHTHYCSGSLFPLNMMTFASFLSQTTHANRYNTKTFLYMEKVTQTISKYVVKNGKLPNPEWVYITQVVIIRILVRSMDCSNAIRLQRKVNDWIDVTNALKTNTKTDLRYGVSSTQ